MPFRDEARERRGPDAPLEVELAAHSTSQLYADLGGTVMGVFASTFLLLERDMHVDLVLAFPDRTSVRARGIVQFVRAAAPDQLPGLGIAFTELADDDRDVIARFAELRPPMLWDE
ncbi:MAG: hypothetical protein JST00_48240 [Deltaproteobacteria bacterium]|nr:hypothetical protein [Deltaproteobacteria bacterium]